MKCTKDINRLTNKFNIRTNGRNETRWQVGEYLLLGHNKSQISVTYRTFLTYFECVFWSNLEHNLSIIINRKFPTYFVGGVWSDLERNLSDIISRKFLICIGNYISKISDAYRYISEISDLFCRCFWSKSDIFWT